MLPRGLVAVLGVDLPHPAMHVEAPDWQAWRLDGWELVHPEGLVNPGTAAMSTARGLATELGVPSVETIVAIGPYAERITQPDSAPNPMGRREFRVVHPSPLDSALQDNARELTADGGIMHTAEVRRVLDTLLVNPVRLHAEDLHREGFARVPAPPLQAEATESVPR